MDARIYRSFAGDVPRPAINFYMHPYIVKLGRAPVMPFVCPVCSRSTGCDSMGGVGGLDSSVERKWRGADIVINCPISDSAFHAERHAAAWLKRRGRRRTDIATTVVHVVTIASFRVVARHGLLQPSSYSTPFVACWRCRVAWAGVCCNRYSSCRFAIIAIASSAASGNFKIYSREKCNNTTVSLKKRVARYAVVVWHLKRPKVETLNELTFCTKGWAFGNATSGNGCAVGGSRRLG